MAKKRNPRGLNPEEQQLWQKITDAIAPLPGRKSSDQMEHHLRPDLLKSEKPKSRIPGMRPRKLPRSNSSQAPLLGDASLQKPQVLKRSSPPAPHDAGTLDGGLQRKLRRGRIEPDAKIDLHGLNQAEAHQRLRSSLPNLRFQGVRCLLVVTGKGSATTLARHTLHGNAISHTPERRGILRDSLPRWLSEAEFRPHVAAVRPAHPRHGGGGAFYVWLRRRK